MPPYDVDDQRDMYAMLPGVPDDAPPEPAPAPQTALLAVDLGLRTGLAGYGGDGRLLWYRSHNFGSAQRLKRGAAFLLDEHAALAWLYIEGGGALLLPWEREAQRRGIALRALSAERWRADLLYAREQRNGHQAKAQADTLARRVIAWSGAARPTSLRHDAAEAILLGLWAVVDCGLLPDYPRELRQR